MGLLWAAFIGLLLAFISLYLVAAFFSQKRLGMSWDVSG